MKHSFLLLALSLGLMGAAQAQNANGHFSMRYAGGVSQNDMVAFCRTQLPKLCEGTTFEITRDNLNVDGMRSVTLQQYVNGVRVNGKTINVHLRNGKIISINGNVMTQDMVAPETLRRAPRPAAQVMQQAGLSDRLAEKAELVVVVKDGVAHQAYLVLVGTDRMHIDAVTGEVLIKTSVIMNADDDPEMVPGKGLTIYSGEQDIETAYMDGAYTLFDLNRNIYTLDGSFDKMVANGLFEKLMSGEDQIASLLDCSDLFLNDSPNWMDTTFKTYLKSLSAEITNPAYLGKCVMGEVFFEDGTSLCTEPALLMDMLTELPLPYIIDNEEQTICKASAYFYDPETGEKDLIGSIASAPCPNVINKDLVDGFSFYINNFFEGYQPAIDIHWGMGKVRDYYLSTFNHDSFDGKGTEVYCLVNPMNKFSISQNASALPLPEGYPGLMLFGLGGTLMYPVVDLVVMGHEFTHLVAQNLASPQPDSLDCYACALNESFADIMGLAIMRQTTGREEWGIGERVMRSGNAFRRLDVPEALDHPSCYLDANFDITKYDEHVNAGVQNHMFYLLVNGGEGINSLGESYYVTPMDRTEAEFLTFTTLVNYTFAEMDYEDAAKAWDAAAADKFGEGSAQHKSVLQAWAAVGLGNGDITSIEQLTAGTQKLGLRYNLQGQRVGSDYTGLVIEK